MTSVVVERAGEGVRTKKKFEGPPAQPPTSDSDSDSARRGCREHRERSLAE